MYSRFRCIQLLFLSGCIALAVGPVACGDSEPQNDCTLATQVMQQGYGSYCASRGDYCCQCDCWNRGFGLTNGELDGQCQCEWPIETSVPDEYCAGTEFADAQLCLADTQACRTWAEDDMAIFCDATIRP